MALVFSFPCAASQVGDLIHVKGLAIDKSCNGYQPLRIGQIRKAELE